MVDSGLNILNNMRKNKNAVTDGDLTFDVTPFEIERFKRHLNGLLERTSRLSASSSEQKSTDTLPEEDDNANDASEMQKTTPTEEVSNSEWVFDVAKNLDVLPRIQINPDADSNISTKD